MITVRGGTLRVDVTDNDVKLTGSANHRRQKSNCCKVLRITLKFADTQKKEAGCFQSASLVGE